MFFAQRLNRHGLEVPALQRTRIQENIPVPLLILTSHPLHQRQLKSLFSPVYHVRRNSHSLRQFFQNLLSGSGTKLPFDRQRGHPFDKFVIQHRHSHFKRGGHAHSIHLGQYVAVQIRLCVEIEQAAQVIFCRGIVVQALPLRERVRKRFCILQKLLSEQITLTVQQGKERQRVQVTIAAIERSIPCQVLPIGSRWNEPMNTFAVNGPEPALQWIELRAPHGRQLPVVPSKQLIATISRQGDGDLLPGHPAYVVGRQHGRVSERL